MIKCLQTNKQTGGWLVYLVEWLVVGCYFDLWEKERGGLPHVRALRSHSIRHSRTNMRAWTMPRFSRSAEDLLPEYVGRISLPMSSMTARSWVYFVWGCCGICGNCGPRLAMAGGGVPWLPCMSNSERGVPGLLITGVTGELDAVPSMITSSSIVRFWNEITYKKRNS